jgi:hypothetical protein
LVPREFHVLQRGNGGQRGEVPNPVRGEVQVLELPQALEGCEVGDLVARQIRRRQGLAMFEAREIGDAPAVGVERGDIGHVGRG